MLQDLLDTNTTKIMAPNEPTQFNINGVASDILDAIQTKDVGMEEEEEEPVSSSNLVHDLITIVCVLHKHEPKPNSQCLKKKNQLPKLQ